MDCWQVHKIRERNLEDSCGGDGHRLSSPWCKRDILAPLLPDKAWRYLRETQTEMYVGPARECRTGNRGKYKGTIRKNSTTCSYTSSAPCSPLQPYCDSTWHRSISRVHTCKEVSLTVRSIDITVKEASYTIVRPNVGLPRWGRYGAYLNLLTGSLNRGRLWQ